MTIPLTITVTESTRANPIANAIGLLESVVRAIRVYAMETLLGDAIHYVA